MQVYRLLGCARLAVMLAIAMRLPAADLRSDFEGRFDPLPTVANSSAHLEGSVFQGWHDDSSWGDGSAMYARDDAVAHGGTSSQRIEVRSLGHSAIQLDCPLKVQKGKIYRIEAFVRGDGFSRAIVMLRKAGAPYDSWGQANVNVTPDWERVEVFAQAPSTDDALVMFLPGSTGTFWLDDVTVSDVDASAEIAGGERGGNAWDNASFETGVAIANGWSAKIVGMERNEAWMEGAGIAQPGIDATTAAHGTSSLTAVLPSWTALLVSSPLTPVAFGRTYSASIAIKSDVPCTIGMSLVGTQAGKEFQAGPTWQRYSVNGRVLLGTSARLDLRVVNRAGPKAAVWIDAAMLEQGAEPSAEYAPTHPCELALGCQRPGGIFHDREPAEVTVSAVAVAGTIPRGSRLVLTSEDLHGTVRELPSVALPVTTLVLPAELHAPCGQYKIRARLADPSGRFLSGPSEYIVTRVPNPRTLPAGHERESFFGTMVELERDKLAIARALGIKDVRLHDASCATLWASVEQKPGTWSFNTAGVTEAKAAGMHVLGLLGGAPSWASRKPQATTGYFANWNLPDADGADAAWAEYVRRTVSAFKDDVDYWEIWNEPYVNGGENAFFPNGTIKQYTALITAAVPVVRAVDPAAFIVGVCAPGHDEAWVGKVLDGAPQSLFDGIAFHAYEGRLQGTASPNIASAAAMIARAQLAHGAQKPVWCSEGSMTDYVSWYANPAAAVRFQIAAQVRLDVSHLANGVRKFFAYTMHSDPPMGQGGNSMLDYDRTPKAGSAARAVLASLVDGASFIAGDHLATDVETYRFHHADGTDVWVLWSEDGKRHRVGVPKGFRAHDVMDNEITGSDVDVGDEPVYLIRPR